MERLNYTLVIISTKEVKSVCAGLWFDDKTAAERYAEGVTAGLALTGKRNYAVIMHPPRQSTRDETWIYFKGLLI